MATTKLDLLKPLVMLNRQAGVTVIQSGTPLTRLNYFDGKFLRAQDLQAEQRYIRSLVELSNQAGGFGVVHGFDLALSGDDMLTLLPGLAIDPQGRVLMLPQECAISIQDLIDRSRESQRLTAAAALKGTGDFGTCTEVSEAPAVAPAAGRDWYLITIAQAEALCGEEDVYGKLCEEACITSTDRPWRVEGVVLRARPLPLDTKLATSSAVTLDRSHLRSLIASAWFEAERKGAGSLISKAGLDSSAWCQGAADVTGSEVALAVLVREGSSTLFLDGWIARREIIDTPPKRYWQGRMGMRPWDVYLAQILQFQCQLRDALHKVPVTTADDDPCRKAQNLVAEAVDHFQALAGFYKNTTAKLSTMSGNSRALVMKEIPAAKIGVEQIASFQEKLVKASQAFKLLPQDRMLIRGGIVELPSAGYLPVIPDSTVSVNQQVRRLVGEGVDLRFCIVRPDFVAHALEEAQHMERISLLEGLDDPDAKPQVDVLVPDGKIAPDQVEQGRFYEMRLNVIPQNLRMLAAAGRVALSRAEIGGAGKSVVTEKATKELRDALDYYMAASARAGAQAKADTVELSGTGRSEELAGGGMAFHYAGASGNFVIEKSVEQKPAANRRTTEAASAADVLKVSDIKTEILLSHYFNVGRDFLQQQIEPEARASLWVSMEIDRDPSTLAQGASANARGECQFLISAAGKLSASQQADETLKKLVGRTSNVLVRAAFTGQLQVEGRETRPAEEQFCLTRASLAGELTITIKDAGGQQSFSLYLSEPVEISSSVGPSGPSYIVKMMEPSVLKSLVQQLEVRRGWKTPTQAEAIGLIYLRTSREQATGEAGKASDGTKGATGILVEEILPATESINLLAASTLTRREAFRTWQTINASVREPNHPAHESAIRALRNIGAVLGSARFADLAAARLFPAPPPKDSELTVLATAPWVMFHRRRNKVCSQEKPAPRIETRQYALYHVSLAGNMTVAALKRMLAAGSAEVLNRIKPDFVQLVEFGAGIHAVISPQAQVRASWRQDVGTDAGEIAGGLIASRGLAAAEGDKLAADRLESLVEVLRADVPVAAAPDYEVLSRVPDALDTGQNDGIIIVATRAVATTCQDVYAVHDTDRLAAVQKVAGSDRLADMLKEVGAELLGAVCFREGTVQDVPETTQTVLDQWNKDYPKQVAGAALLIYKKGDAAAEIYTQQAKVVVEKLGGTALLQRAEGPAALPNNRLAITIVVPVAPQPGAGRMMRAMIVPQKPLTATLRPRAVRASDIKTDPTLDLGFDAAGGLAGGGLTEAASGWIRQNLVEKKLAAEAVTLVVQADPPDAAAPARLDTALQALKEAGVVKPEATSQVKTMSSISAEALGKLLQPHFAKPSPVDELLVLSVSSS